MVSIVKEYLFIYYKNDDAVRSDTKIQQWWIEIRNVGHGDKKEQDMVVSHGNVEEVEKPFTTIVWVALDIHALVNF